MKSSEATNPSNSHQSVASVESLKHQIVVCQTIARLVRAKLPIAGELGKSLGRSSGPSAELARTVDDGLSQGKSLSSLLISDDTLHSRVLSACIDAGESTGKLDRTLQNWTSMHLANASAKRSLLHALLYPGVLLTVAVFSVSLVFWKLVPQYEISYQMFETEMPGWLSAIVWVRERFALLPIAMAICLLIPIAVWIWNRRGFNRDGLPREKSRRLRLQGLSTELIAMLIEEQQPLAEVTRMGALACGLAREKAQAAFGRIQKQQPITGFPRETSILLSSIHSGLLEHDAGAETLHQVAGHYHQSADIHAVRQVQWIPMLVALSVGAVTVLTYAILIYLPWVWLMRQVVTPAM